MERQARADASWQWIQCDTAPTDSCRRSPARRGELRGGGADGGKRLRVMLTVRNKDGSSLGDLRTDQRRGRRARRPPPLPVADRDPRADRHGDARPAGSRPRPPSRPRRRWPRRSRPAPCCPAPRPRRTMMRPAPVVRIRGRLSRSGARITLLTVQAPRGAAITRALPRPRLPGAALGAHDRPDADRPLPGRPARRHPAGDQRHQARADRQAHDDLDPPRQGAAAPRPLPDARLTEAGAMPAV